jgi:hypothetical protein
MSRSNKEERESLLDSMIGVGTASHLTPYANTDTEKAQPKEGGAKPEKSPAADVAKNIDFSKLFKKEK